MPSGMVLGMPKPTGGSGISTPQWGTVEFVSSAKSWNVSTTTCATPEDNEFWASSRSSTSSAYHYVWGASQHGTQTGEGIISSHNGTNGWTSLFLDILKPRPGATWNTTVNHNLYGSYPGVCAVRFSYTEGFQIRPYQGLYTQHANNANNQTHTPRTNKGPYPGGLCVAGGSHESCGSGMTGISAASTAAGWGHVVISGTGSTGIIVFAYYILSATEIETAPTVNFTSACTANCWSTASAYIR